MANSPQAKKRARQAVKKRLHNMSIRSMMRTQLKKLTAMIEKKDQDGAKALYGSVTKTLDQLAAKGLIHKNKAARHKSRFSSHIKALAAA